MFAHDITRSKLVNLSQARIIRINQPETDYFTVEAVFGTGDSETVEVLAGHDSYDKAQKSMRLIQDTFRFTSGFIKL